MTFADEREALVRTGRTLLEKGLVARTWGNLSIRVSAYRFLITPSGRNYETVRPEDLALVSTDDLSWEGPLKPSSEKELHARIYRTRHAAGAVIHTHQSAASALAASRRGFSPSADGRDGGADVQPGVSAGGTDRGAGGLGPAVPCVPYALPTTKKLAGAVEKVLADWDDDVKALLLSNHGAVCLGVDIDDALNAAVTLEEAAEAEILAGFRKRTGMPDASPEDVMARALNGYAGGWNPADGGEVPANQDETGKSRGQEFESDIEEFLTAVRKRFPGASVHRTSAPHVKAAAGRGRTVRPLLDDFAQIIGPTLPAVTAAGGDSVEAVVRALKRRSAVLVGNVGCICLAESESDSRAVAMVAEKGCRAAIVSAIIGGGRRINPVEARLMRFIYLSKYSRKAA